MNTATNIVNSASSGDISAPSATTAKTLTIYFDGGCPVCSKEIAYYQRQVGAQACEWIDASSCTDAALGANLLRKDALARFHVRHPNGALTSGMGGFAALWRVLPKTAWLGRIASIAPMPFLLDQAYRVFLAVRPLWRAQSVIALRSAAPQAASATPSWPAHIVKELRSDQAGEVGAVQIYRGMLAVTRNAELRSFAEHHLATEQAHLLTIESHLALAQHSRLLAAWRVAGWLTGALPALFGPRAAYATVAAVETFVDKHYAEQVAWIDSHLAHAEKTNVSAADAQNLATLRADLERCRLDELQHRDEALSAGAAKGWLIGLWTRLVSSGSASAVALARRF